jgi:hypothetical protein
MAMATAEATTEEVLLAFYAHFEPSFATRDKVRKIISTFRKRTAMAEERYRSGEVGAARDDAQFPDAMYRSIAQQRVRALCERGGGASYE